MKFRFNFRFLLLGIAMLLIQICVSRFLSGKGYGLFIDYVSGISKVVFLFSMLWAFGVGRNHRLGVIQLLLCTAILVLFQCMPFPMSDRDMYISLGILTGGVIEIFTFIEPVRTWFHPEVTDLEE